jgi:hypothetical protein
MVLIKRFFIVIVLIAIISFIFSTNNPNDNLPPLVIPKASSSDEYSNSVVNDHASKPNTVKTELFLTTAKLSKTDNILEKLLNDCADIEPVGYVKQQLSNQQNDYLALLKESNNSDDKLALFIQKDIGNGSYNFEHLLAITTSPLNKKLHYEQQLLLCNQNFDATYCNNELYKQAISVDKDNAYLWHLIAAVHFSQDQPEKALTAIVIANTKNYFNDYYFESIKFIEQSYQNNSSIVFNTRLI